jgi:hypothetical protein
VPSIDGTRLSLSNNNSMVDTRDRRRTSQGRASPPRSAPPSRPARRRVPDRGYLAAHRRPPPAHAASLSRHEARARSGGPRRLSPYALCASAMRSPLPAERLARYDHSARHCPASRAPSATPLMLPAVIGPATHYAQSRRSFITSTSRTQAAMPSVWSVEQDTRSVLPPSNRVVAGPARTELAPTLTTQSSPAVVAAYNAGATNSDSPPDAEGGPSAFAKESLHLAARVPSQLPLASTVPSTRGLPGLLAAGSTLARPAAPARAPLADGTCRSTSMTTARGIPRDDRRGPINCCGPGPPSGAPGRLSAGAAIHSVHADAHSTQPVWDERWTRPRQRS